MKVASTLSRGDVGLLIYKLIYGHFAKWLSFLGQGSCRRVEFSMNYTFIRCIINTLLYKYIQTRYPRHLGIIRLSEPI